MQRDRGMLQGGRGPPRGPPVGMTNADSGPPPPWLSKSGSMGGGGTGGGGRDMTPADMEAEHQAMREAARAKKSSQAPPTEPHAQRPQV